MLPSLLQPPVVRMDLPEEVGPAPASSMLWSIGPRGRRTRQDRRSIFASSITPSLRSRNVPLRRFVANGFPSLPDGAKRDAAPRRAGDPSGHAGHGRDPSLAAALVRP